MQKSPAAYPQTKSGCKPRDSGIKEQAFFPRKRPFSARQGALMESAVCQWQTLFTPSVTLTRAIPS